MTQRPSGFLHWMFPAMLGFVALTVLVSGRDLSRMFLELQQSIPEPTSPIVIWGQRIVSLLLIGIAGERIVSHFAAHRPVPSPSLAWAFVIYWLATVAAPALFGAHPQIGHDYLYTLAIGFAGLLATEQERDKILDLSRDTLFVFLIGSLALVPVVPSMAVDASYTQGLLPGVPRLGGLAPHPVALGTFAQIFLLFLWCRPFRRWWWNLPAWLVGGTCLFFAQSKTAWIAFVLCTLCLVAVRNGTNAWRRLGDPREGAFGAVLLLATMALVLVVTGFILLGDVGSTVSSVLDTDEGAQLMTFTGRDKIWAIAMEEWHNSPVFGYGPGLFDADFRASIGMPNATNGHNQFMDTLARSGSVGATALVLYAFVLLVLSLRYARATGGLSVALFVALALRSVSEVPLVLFGYGAELFTHLLLIVTLASAAGARRAVDNVVPRNAIYSGAS
jgi:O-antigen ligase